MGACTHCDGNGFLNLDQVPSDIISKALAPCCSDWERDIILRWIEENDGHDVSVCNCCGNGEDWHGIPGSHYSSNDPAGPHGPYAYNGGLCECH